MKKFIAFGLMLACVFCLSLGIGCKPAEKASAPAEAPAEAPADAPAETPADAPAETPAS